MPLIRIIGAPVPSGRIEIRDVEPSSYVSDLWRRLRAYGVDSREYELRSKDRFPSAESSIKSLKLSSHERIELVPRTKYYASDKREDAGYASVDLLKVPSPQHPKLHQLSTSLQFLAPQDLRLRTFPGTTKKCWT